MKSFKNLNKTDVVFSSSEFEDLEIAVRTLLEATSWMDWWYHAAKSLAMPVTSVGAKMKQLFVAGAKTQLLVERLLPPFG